MYLSTQLVTIPAPFTNSQFYLVNDSPFGSQQHRETPRQFSFFFFNHCSDSDNVG